LVLDELGYVPFSKIGAQLLFEVVGRAYEQQSLMVTTNLPFEKWTEVFGSERLTGALLDRMTHRCHIIEANGESYRLRQAKKRSKTLKKNKNNNYRVMHLTGVTTICCSMPWKSIRRPCLSLRRDSQPTKIAGNTCILCGGRRAFVVHAVPGANIGR
jgi:hypothetical protein